jgi:hypothetical protein
MVGGQRQFPKYYKKKLCMLLSQNIEQILNLIISYNIIEKLATLDGMVVRVVILFLAKNFEVEGNGSHNLLFSKGCLLATPWPQS